MGNQRVLLNVSADHVDDGGHIILQHMIGVVGDILLLRSWIYGSIRVSIVWESFQHYSRGKQNAVPPHWTHTTATMYYSNLGILKGWVYSNWVWSNRVCSRVGYSQIWVCSYLGILVVGYTEIWVHSRVGYTRCGYAWWRYTRWGCTQIWVCSERVCSVGIHSVGGPI